MKKQKFLCIIFLISLVFKVGKGSYIILEGDKLAYLDNYDYFLQFDKDGTLVEYILNSNYLEVKEGLSFQEIYNSGKCPNSYKYLKRIRYRIGNHQKVPNPPFTLEISDEGKLGIKDKDKVTLWEYDKKITTKGKKYFVSDGIPFSLKVPWRYNYKRNPVYGEDGKVWSLKEYIDKKNKEYSKVPLEIKEILLNGIKEQLESWGEPQGRGIDEKDSFNLQIEDKETLAFTDTHELYNPIYFKNFRSNYGADHSKQHAVHNYVRTLLDNKMKIIYDEIEENKPKIISMREFFESKVFHINYKCIIISLYKRNEKLYYHSIVVSVAFRRENSNASKQDVERHAYLKILKHYEEAQERLDKEKKEGKEGKDDKKVKLRKNLRDIFESENTKPLSERSVYCLIDNAKRDTHIVFETFNKNSLNEISKKYNFPDLIKEQLEAIAFSKSGFETKKLKFEQSKNELIAVIYEEILGVTIKEGDNIMLAFGHSTCTGYIIDTLRKWDWDSPLCKEEWMEDLTVLNNKFAWKALKKEGSGSKIYVRYCPYTGCQLNEQRLKTMESYLKPYSLQGLIKKLELMDITQTLLTKLELVSNNKRYIAELGEDGRIYIGSSVRRSSLFQNPLYTVGTTEGKLFSPYSLIISEKGQLMIINNDNDRVWKAKMLIQSGVGPFKLILTDDSTLKVIDSKEQTISNLKVNNS